MNYSKKTFTTLFLALFAFTSMTLGQKFGHINSQQLLVESPLITNADSKLVTYQEILVTKGKAMVSAFETSYAAYAKDREAGTLSQIQIQQRESELTATQQEIQKYEIEVQQKLAMKREELYKPILDKVKVVMDAIGRDESFTMIFDTSTNGLLYAVDGEDLMAKVKAKLGW